MPLNPAAPKLGTDIAAAEETTPLLSGSDRRETFEQDESIDHEQNHPVTSEEANGTAHDGFINEEDKPLPYVQILLLCYASLAEPVAFFAILPFINEMAERVGGLKESDVGFWSGLIESLFSIVQMCLMIFYGRLSDRLGRKPVLVFSLAGISVATALFGMSQSLWQMVLFRCLAGVFAGSAVTVRTMIGENCTKKTQAKAFGWYMFTRNLGISIGPLIGGGLANPAEHFGKAFDAPFWHHYPYALSTYACAALVLTSTVVVVIFSNETLQRKPTHGDSVPAPEMTTWEILKHPGVAVVLYIYGHVMLCSVGYTAVSPVFLYTSIESGGFDFSDQSIALFFALAGFSQAFWMLLCFPILQRKFGTGSVLRGCSIGISLFFAMFPILNIFLRNGWRLAFKITAPIGLFFGSAVAMSFGCIQLFVNDISPTSKVLGTLNAFALTVNSAIRAFAPVLFTSIFEAGIKWGFAGGHLVWFILIALALGMIVASHFVPEAAEGRPDKD